MEKDVMKFVLKSSKTHEFELDVELDGEKVDGKFICRYPSVIDHLTAQSEVAKMLAGADPKLILQPTESLAFKVAYLRLLLIKSPHWFDLDAINDTNIFNAVYEEVDKFIVTFQRGDERYQSKGSSDGPDDEEHMEGV